MAADEGAGDSEQLQADKTKLTLLRREYRDFSTAAGLRRQSDRLFTAAGGGKEAGSALTGQPDGGIIEITTPPEEKADVHTVGYIDREIYKCVTEDIRTDEVIITDERIAHIKDSRGQAFLDKYERYFNEVLSAPDYIFKDKHIHSARVCKSIATENDAVINLVIRLAVESDGSMFKNSIITAIKESNKRFAQRLRNNKPLYKRE